MKFSKIAILIGVFAASPAYTKDEHHMFIPHLTDCSAFFGLLSQSGGERAEQFKELAYVFAAYASQVIPENVLEKEVGKSKAGIADMVARAKKNEDKEIVSNQLSMCMDTLESAEASLRPKMSDEIKAMVPKIYK